MKYLTFNRRPQLSSVFSVALLVLGLTMAGAASSAVKSGAVKPGLAKAPADQKRQRIKAALTNLPFRLDVVETPNSALPSLHSFTSASLNGKWLAFGGRVVGLHTFTASQNNFPQNSQNLTAYVLDPINNQQVASLDLTTTDLPQNVLWEITATNQESVQVSGDLFIVGGYGHQFVSGSTTQAPMVTFGTMIKVDVNGLMTAIQAGQTNIAQYFTSAAAPDNRLMVTGGNLKFSNGLFYLVYGQKFSGYYSVQNSDYNKAGGQFQQYTDSVRAFTLQPDLSIGQFLTVTGPYDPSQPYHRRDLNVVDVIQSDGATPAATIYGGVFMAGQFGGFLNPIDLTYSTTLANINVTLQSSFRQGLSQYDCASMTLFDSGSSSCFTTLFGGISQFHYDPITNTLILDPFNLPVDGMPFVKTITTIQRAPNSVYSQYIQPTVMPTYLGADAQFWVAPNVPTFPNGVINLSQLSGKTLVGYVYGGIQSTAAYSGLSKQVPPTFASNRIFAIYVTPGSSPVIAMPPVPAGPSAGTGSAKKKPARKK